MKWKTVIIVVVVCLLVGLGILASVQSGSTKQALPTPSPQRVMQLTSAFGNNEPIPAVYTCKGQNISPPLHLSGVPQEAKSLALTVDDPDAPVGTFHHWLMWNIPPQMNEIGEGITPTGVSEGTNGAGKIGYMGPCPPRGTHHYIFKLFALDTILNLPLTTKTGDLESAMKDHILIQTQLTGLYGK